jgi:hypothetical protein
MKRRASVAEGRAAAGEEERSPEGALMASRNDSQIGWISPDARLRPLLILRENSMGEKKHGKESRCCVWGPLSDFFHRK